MPIDSEELRVETAPLRAASREPSLPGGRETGGQAPFGHAVVLDIVNDSDLFVMASLVRPLATFETDGAWDFQRDGDDDVVLRPFWCEGNTIAKHYQPFRWKGETDTWSKGMVVLKVYFAHGRNWIEWKAKLLPTVPSAPLQPSDCLLNATTQGVMT